MLRARALRRRRYDYARTGLREPCHRLGHRLSRTHSVGCLSRNSRSAWHNFAQLERFSSDKLPCCARGLEVDAAHLLLLRGPAKALHRRRCSADACQLPTNGHQHCRRRPGTSRTCTSTSAASHAPKFNAVVKRAPQLRTEDKGFVDQHRIRIRQAAGRQHRTMTNNKLKNKKQIIKHQIKTHINPNYSIY